MNVINLLSGIQICSVSLKVSAHARLSASVVMARLSGTASLAQVQLASLFPEDMADDDDTQDDDGLLALPDPTELAHSVTPHKATATASLRGTKGAGQTHDFSSHTLVLQVGNLASPLERTQVQLKPQVRWN